MLATLASKPFSDPDWLFEIKWDGFRVQAVVDGGQGQDLTAEPARRRDVLPAPPVAAVLDQREAGDRRWRGRRLDDVGRPDFGLLQTSSASRARRASSTRPFDLLYLDGRLLLDVPLEDRKRLLRSVLKEHPRVRYAAHIEGEGLAFHEAAAAKVSRA